MSEASVILASASPTRARLLRAADVPFEVVRPTIDEDALKAQLRAQGLDTHAQARALAQAKAEDVSRLRPGLVIGADQMLSLDGRGFDKPVSKQQARADLMALCGRTHELATALCVAKAGQAVWRFLDAPRLTMRRFSERFVDAYLDTAGENILGSVGGYQLEGAGAQLFERVEGDFFSILGLPLLPLLAFLREAGAVQS